MVVSLWGKLRRLRRWLSRNEATVRWLRMSRSANTTNEPGLVLVQIDGLSRAQLERALKRRRMPFLQKLLRKRGYTLETMYSGLPSSTPAVQGELFYGVQCAVPAFSYRDPTTQQVVRMFDNAPAASVQARLAAQGEGLLAGGSAYCNIYSGGAAEPHFCAATTGLGSVLQGINPLVILSIIFWNFYSIVRTSILMVIEFGLALVDFVRGQFAGRSLWHELKFVPTRVFVNIALRELVTVGASLDVTRGLPVVQMNYLGYDEQAHRRGPSSRFAHWSLKGIDDSIKRVWTASRRSNRRKYTLVVYSDHGQERVAAYQRKFGQPVQQAIADVFGRAVVMEGANQAHDPEGVAYARVQWAGGRLSRNMPRPAKPTIEHARQLSQAVGEPIVEVDSMGPIGHIYPAEQYSEQQLDHLAAELVAAAHIPMVLRPCGETARVWTQAGVFELPTQAAEVLGGDHPFLAAAARDLVALCRHPSAGVLVIGGWSQHAPPISFARENGSHAGPGPEETHAFVLAPHNVPFKRDGRTPRALDLRNALLEFLGRPVAAAPPCPAAPATVETAAGLGVSLAGVPRSP